MHDHEVSMKYWFKRDQERLCDLIGSPLFQKLLRSPPLDPAYDLLITELSIVHCYIPFGPHLDIPVIGIVTTPLCDYQYDGFGATKNLAVQRSMFSAYSESMLFFERVENYLNYHRAIRNYNDYTRPQEKYIRKYFGEGYPGIINLPRHVSLVLINHDISIDGIESFAPKVIPVGGLHIVDHNESLPKAVQSWLDESTDGCIYFSFGSMIRIETFPRHILNAFYKSFENVKPVRVLLKITKPEELPPGLPSNVLTRPWFQQIAVLKHRNVKAFVTHGGLMGTQEAIYYGIPMVGVPMLGDQSLNIKKYVAKGVATTVGFQDITEQTFTCAIKQVLKNPLYRQSLQRLSKQFRDRPMPPLETAIYWIEYIHRHGKNALKSSIEDMPWWQASLLDVYAFIAGSFLIALYIFIKLFQMLRNLCSKKLDIKSSTNKKDN
ncbi:UDP-glycosyltransferase UGT5-like isoform X2 [Phymastichus coffea]|nr:UDP-glycosyltransferase UGT5-like isoform X2 [Phymastichus coffea]XP_058790296.1 UDP-glycosyltransferase UGT5-like isoform X2 [Phymastichus coffea]